MQRHIAIFFFMKHGEPISYRWRRSLEKGGSMWEAGVVPLETNTRTEFLREPRSGVVVYIEPPPLFHVQH